MKLVLFCTHLFVLLARVYPTRKEEYAKFGYYAATMLSASNWLPSRLFALLIATGHQF
ncbi:hypothetical protein [Candidatus Enterovibrio altilux]|uniref:hypothetical protein n=1 Tax=Candidatus Enterovibrio altilux TaxID=1927128 RepID=UPI001CC22DB5|nr:hypothetical protein [Candidatus Enterovibrio luxaltus]